LRHRETISMPLSFSLRWIAGLAEKLLHICRRRKWGVPVQQKA
jgi:hypothetical protein